MNQEIKNTFEKIQRETLVKQIAVDILLSNIKSGTNLSSEQIELNEKIKKVYNEWTSETELPKDKILPTLVTSEPGLDTSSVFKDAAQKVAKALELNFLLNPYQKVSKKDFVFIGQECVDDGRLEMGGPSFIETTKTKDELDKEYTVKIMNRCSKMFEKSAAGAFLLEDLPSANPMFQNIAYEFIDKKLNNNFYIGLSSERKFQLSAGLNKTKIFSMEETLPKFLDRIKRKYKNESATFVVTSFLDRFPQFYVVAFRENFNSGFVPTTKKWEDIIIQVQKLEKIYKSENKTLPEKEMERLATYVLGKDEGKMFAEFHKSSIKPYQYAQEGFDNNNWNLYALKKETGDGLSANEQNFSYQYCCALSSLAAKKISDHKEQLKEIIEQFSAGLKGVPNSMIPFALTKLKNELVIRDDSLSVKTVNGYDLKNEIKIEIAQTIKKNTSLTDPFSLELLEKIKTTTPPKSGLSNK